MRNLGVAPYLDRAAWLAMRNARIGSTDIGAILGQDEFTSDAEVWDRIVLGVQKDAEGADIRRGNKQEAIAVATFEELYGLATERLPMVAHDDHPYLVTDVDRVIPPLPEWPLSLAGMMEPQQGPGALEIKVPRVATFYKYRDEGLPLRYILQHQNHFAVTGFSWGVFAFYTPEYDDLIAFPVLRDSQFIDDIMLPRLIAWWKRHVLTKARPTRKPADPPRWPTKVLGRAKQREDEAWLAAAAEHARHVAEFEAARGRAELSQSMLLSLLADDDTNVAGGGIAVQRRSTPSQRRFDAKAFRAAVKLAQQEEDTDTLLAIDPDDDAFYYQTASSEKVEVRLTSAAPHVSEEVFS